MLPGMATVGPGELIAGQYRLIAEIGRGGMGSVWQARDELLDRQVAVKALTIPPSLGPDERQGLVRRTVREARSAARLDHPAVITIYNIVEHDESPWIVMEYVEGRSLQDAINGAGPLPPEDAARIGLQVLHALSAAHRAGVVHRDVKPGNVLLKGDRAILTDFGVAALDGDPTLTRTGGILGTPAYMAPEQARGLGASAESDLWSLGATLYAAVEGRPPFGGSNVMATLAALVTEDPPAAGHSGPLRPVIEGLLRKDPARRLTAEQAITALADVLRSGVMPGGGARSAPAADEAEHVTPAVVPPRLTTAQRAVRHLATLQGQVGLVRAVAFGVDGEHFAVGGSEGAVALWDTRTHAPVAVLAGHREDVNAVVFGPDGRLLASAGDDGTVRLWDVRSHDAVAVFPGHDGHVDAVAFSPDGRILATGGVDGTVRLWDPASRLPMAVLGWAGPPVADLAFSPRERVLAAVEAGSGVRLWSLDSGRAAGFVAVPGVNAVTFGPDGTVLFTGGDGGTVDRWNPRTAEHVSPLSGRTGDVFALAVSPDGSVLASGGSAGVVELTVIAADESVATLMGHTLDVRSVAFSPDGGLLLSASDDESVSVWGFTE
jgi:hypothetical protein